MARRRHHRCKPDGNHGNRIRRTPQSTRETQVRDADAMSVLMASMGSGSILSTESSHRGQHQGRTSEWNGRMVLPTTEFVRLLKSVGAKGELASCGELFTVKQLCFYLKEYIKCKELFDASNPLLIHCENDPLGKVFSVKSFTFHNALPLVMKNILVVNSSLTRWRHSSPLLTDDALRMAAVSCASPLTNTGIDDDVMENPHLASSSQHDSINQVTSTTTVPRTPQTPRKQFLRHRSETDEEEVSSDKPFSSPSSSAVKHLFLDTKSITHRDEQRDKESGEITHRAVRHSRRRQSTSHVDDLLHPIDSNRNKSDHTFMKTNRKRRHTTSESLTKCSYSKYNHSADELDRCSQSWCFEADLGDSDSDETIYSIQSKETVYVKDSSDDLWFLEEDDTSIEIESVQLGHFEGEYELETEVESEHFNDYDLSDGSESPCEVIVKCDDSDMQFWADSESETESTDGELRDKWKCCKCGTKNQALSRHCSRCWSIRTGWLPDQDTKTSGLSDASVTQSRTDVSSGSRHIQSSLDHPACEDGHCGQSGVSHYCSSESGVSKDCLSKNIVMDRFFSSQPEIIQSRGHSTPTANDTGDGQVSHTASTTCTSLTHSESDTRLDLFKIPSLVGNSNNNNNELGLCSAKGRLLPRLKLLSDDSGNGSLTSSQESASSVHSSCQELSVTSPLKKPRTIGYSDRVSSSPRKCPVSPYKRYSPFPASPFSTKQNLFQFDQLLSPGKRLCQTDRYAVGLSVESLPATSSKTVTSISSPLKSDSSRRIFFVDPLPSPKKRAPNGVEYSDLCMICLSKPKEASIIHGKTGHQVCCYLCAKRLRRRGKPCPVCRRHIQKVVKNYLV